MLSINNCVYSDSKTGIPFAEYALAAKHVIQVGIGMAIATLIDITVNATVRHTVNAAIASEAATALVRRGEATRVTRPSNPPLVPCDRMA